MENPFDSYYVETQIRIHQSGKLKGQTYEYHKFRNKKTGKLVKNAQVMKEAKIVFKSKPAAKTGKKSEKYIPIKESRMHTRLRYTIRIKGYVRRHDTDYGEAGTIAGDVGIGEDTILHYRTQAKDDVIDVFSAFEYRKEGGGSDVPRDMLKNHRNEYIYGNAEIILEKVEVERS